MRSCIMQFSEPGEIYFLSATWAEITRWMMSDVAEEMETAVQLLWKSSDAFLMRVELTMCLPRDLRFLTKLTR